MTRLVDPSEFLNNPQLQEFCRGLDTLPSWARRKKLNEAKPKSYPCFLYKYRAFDLKGDDQIKLINQLRDYLVESRLWLSSPVAFNDPFDMRGTINFDGKPQEKRKRIINKLKKFQPHLAREQREHEASRLLADGFDVRLQNIQEKLRNNCGVCSFAGDPRNLLMWAHYGSSHAGICMQFEIAEDAAVFASAVPVEYSKTYPVINYLMNELTELTKTMLTQKSEHWGYEHERRIIHPNGANAYLGFRPSALTALIFGCELKPHAEDEIKKLLVERRQKGHPAVKVFRACRHETEYRLYFKRVRDLETR